jgi:hypothetical protein
MLTGTIALPATFLILGLYNKLVQEDGAPRRRPATRIPPGAVHAAMRRTSSFTVCK